MALVTHQLQGSCVSFPSGPSSSSRCLTLKRCGVKVHVAAIEKMDRCLSPKRRGSLRLRAPCSSLLVPKSLRISSFKGTAHNEESSAKTHGFKVSSNSLNLSYVPKDVDGNVIGSPKAHDIPVSYTSEANSVATSSAFQKLFQKWLSIVHTRPSKPPIAAISGEVLPPGRMVRSETRIEEKEKNSLLKAIWTHFWGLDSTIKLPAILFIPLYLGVNVTYGREVSKELTPLWVIGPLIVALYVKLFRGIWALYAFTFKQTVKVSKSLPAYFLLAYKYVARGKLKDGMQARVWHPVVHIRNTDYKDLSGRKLGEFREWLLDKYLDCVVLIWPYYCRTIRFSKRANLI